jgi:hypothetical protein
MGVRVGRGLDGMLVGVVPGDAAADGADKSVMHLMAGDCAQRPAADAPYGMGGSWSLNSQDGQDGANCRKSTHTHLPLFQPASDHRLIALQLRFHAPDHRPS